MSITEVVVDELFGEFRHEIRLNEGLTLIHGQNGVGKTTVLSILDALFGRKFNNLRRIPFGAVAITFSEGDRLHVKRVVPDPDGPRSTPDRLEFMWVPLEGTPEHWTFKVSEQGPDFPIHMVDDYIPELTRVAPREWVDVTTGQNLDLNEVLDRYADRLPAAGGPNRRTNQPPSWLHDRLSSVPVYLIGAQRLSALPNARAIRSRRVQGDQSFQVPAVAVYAEDLAEKIRRSLATYADFSQTLDSTFPNRLLGTEQVAPSLVQIQTRYRAQSERRLRFEKAGLLDAGSDIRLPARDLQSVELLVLGTYLDDIELKLNQLDDLADKLELFLNIVNAKFKRKTVLVDREVGLRVVTDSGEALQLASLSSGEQQEVVLAYGLLFREQPGTLILLDEPELSLHVSWQLDLIPDLLQIARLNSLEFLIATHSPQIINDRWDLTVDLGDRV